MYSIIDLIKKADETEEQFLWRVGQMVDSGMVENWGAVNEQVNRAILGDDEDKYRTESAWRKRYQAGKAFYNNCFSKMESKTHEKNMDAMNRELQRNTIKLRDNRNAWNRQNYSDARVDETMDLLESTLPLVGKTEFPNHNAPSHNQNNDLLVCLSDLHIGETFCSKWGRYNTSIAKRRLDEYLHKVIEIGETHNASRIHCVNLGDEISGAIHSVIQITNKENVVEQVKIAIELISSFLYDLTEHFELVYFYHVDGNHSRLNPNKDGCVRDERLDDLIAWSICKLLSNVSNFVDMSNCKVDSTLSITSIHYKEYWFIHGDMDSITKTGIGNLVTAVGKCPDYIICGHKHTPAMNEFNGIRVYQSGSIVGSGDDYTVKHRMSGKPSQTVLVCNESGVVCNYDITLEI